MTDELGTDGPVIPQRPHKPSTGSGASIDGHPKEVHAAAAGSESMVDADITG
ncbi:hypothetical protein [Mycolicibacterium llatzerense]|uniref:hypothetical protein n=1 Tax=Mycolicibacterium llatzerense TaxID=280871 RepID=UPI001F1D9711|nr:hypothetical protein [Mycolicibacterium llatzerense]